MGGKDACFLQRVLGMLLPVCREMPADRLPFPKEVWATLAGCHAAPLKPMELSTHACMHAQLPIWSDYPCILRSCKPLRWWCLSENDSGLISSEVNPKEGFALPLKFANIPEQKNSSKNKGPDRSRLYVFQGQPVTSSLSAISYIDGLTDRNSLFRLVPTYLILQD